MESLSPNSSNTFQSPPQDAKTPPPSEDISPLSPKTIPYPLALQFPDVLSTSSQSDGVLTPGSSTTTQTRHRDGSKSSTPRPRLNCKQPPRNSSIIFSPRPYEILYTERAYLTASLQNHAAKAAGLGRHFSSLEARLQNIEPGKERRQLVKKLNALRTKLNEVAEQEKAVFNRLGELFVEIQSRETWSQASQTRAYSYSGYSMDSPSGYGTASPLSCVPTPITPLNAMSADFVPGGYFSSWQPEERNVNRDEEVEVQIGLETVDEAGEEALYVSDLTDAYYDSEEVDGAAAHEEALQCQRRRLSCDTGDMRMRERRLSLPCARTDWPEV